MDKYDYIYVGGENNSFYFITDNKIVYEIKFKDSSYLFDGRLEFPIVAFEFVLEIEENPDNVRPPLDNKIPYTVAAIFRDFFAKNDEQIIIYICDSSDAKQAIRRRKFNQWVEFFKGNEFLKIDLEIEESSKITYYNSLILRTNHPNRQIIIDVFISLADEQEK